MNAGDMDGTDQAGGLSRRQQLASQKGRVEPLGTASFLMQANLDGADLPLLAEGCQYSLAWLGNEGLRVRITAYPTVVNVGRMKASSVFTVKNENTDAALRVIKVASTDTAAPGETVEFTIRFDNIGTQPIGNVTVLDSLSGRLELIPETAKSSLPAGFAVELNAAGSLMLRWEITAPLEPLDFGIIQFRCRVR
jgi:uncharacterized repeat protein (TIGR01451 family)